jgi:serine/threonine protein phosphatase 1
VERKDGKQMRRTLVVGDVHGKRDLLQRLLVEMAYRPEEDRLVLIGDLVDRGEDSSGVVSLALELKQAAPGQVTVLRGNHEDMMVEGVLDPEGQVAQLWYYNGGIETLESYVGPDGELQFPEEHFDFLRSLPTWAEDEHAIYVHAALVEDANGSFCHPSEGPDDPELLWSRNRRFYSDYRGKTVVFGHTITGMLFGEPEEVWLQESVICVDTGAYMSGVLSAVELPSRQVYRVRESLQGKVWKALSGGERATRLGRKRSPFR